VTALDALLQWPGRVLGLQQGLLIAALVVVALVHTRSRIGGSLLTASWCVAAAFFGWHEFAGRDGGLVFLTIQTPKWVFFSAVGGVFAYNVVVAVRGLTRRVAAPAPSSKPRPASSAAAP